MLSLIQFCQFSIQIITNASNILQYIAIHCSLQYINVLDQLYCIVLRQKILQYSNISICDRVWENRSYRHNN